MIPNKFALLTPDGELHRREDGALFSEFDGVGHHEVIVETPAHGRTMPDMGDEEVERILGAYRARYRALREDPRVRCILIFKNHGERAGTSLEHSHSQLVATPVAPALIRRKCDIASSHYDDTGRCLYCELVDGERTARVRLVLETDEFVVFHPFASRAPFETWIAPTRHVPSFAQVSDHELAALSRVLRVTLRALAALLGGPAFNFMIHSAPVEDESKPYYLWHIQILPRVSTIAGFELGSGIYVTTALPEESAVTMRDAVERCAGAAGTSSGSGPAGTRGGT